MLGALFLAGCGVDQEKEVAQYRSVLDAHVPPAPATQPGEPLTLDRALREANQASEELGIRGEDYLQGLILKNRATAAFLPTVAFRPTYTVEDRYTNTPGRTNTLTTTGGDTATIRGSSASVTTVGTGYRSLGSNALQSFQAPVVGQINLFHGFGDAANLRVADATIEQRKQLLLDAQSTVLINVAQVYYQVLRSEQTRDVLRNSIMLQQARVDDESQKLKNGLSTNLALAQVQAQLDSTRAALAQVDGDVINGRTTLGFLIGRPVESTTLISDTIVPNVRPAKEEFERLAQEGRRDLLAARAQVVAARAAVDVAVAQYYPSVNLNVEGFLYREYYSDASKWNAVLSANVPIFSAGVIRADVRNAWSRLRQAALVESETRRSAIRDVQTAYQNVLTAERRITELQGELTAANDALKQAQAALANNLGIVLDVLTAQDQQLNSQLQLTSAEFDRSVFYLDLVRSTGRIPLNLPKQPPPAIH